MNRRKKMNKEEGNFWTGLLVGKMLGGKKNNSNNNNGGCLSTIMGLIIIGIAIFLGMNFGVKGIIIGAVLVFIVIPVIIGILKGKKQYTNNTAEEAWNLFNQGNYTLALEKAEQVAEKNADAADLAGILYLNGEGCDVNLEKAFHYFELGKNKNMEAKANYALMLLNGNGCEQNIEIGKKELINAAAIGKNTLAIMRLGEFQISGEFGFEKNVEKGMKNLRIAIDEGYPYAMYLVGSMQYFGVDGVPENKEKGLELLKKAADNGVQDAIDALNNLNQA